MKRENLYIEFCEGFFLKEELIEWGLNEGYKILVFDDFMIDVVDSMEMVYLFCVGLYYYNIIVIYLM